MKSITRAALVVYALCILGPVFTAGNFSFFSATQLYAEQEKKSTKKESKKEKKSAKKTEDAAPAVEPAADAKPDAAADVKPDAPITDPVIQNIYNYDKPQREETSYGWLIFKTFIVIGLLAAGFWYFYKFIVKKTGLPNIGTQAIKVLAVTPLGANKSLNIVDIGGHIFLLGVTDSNINLITEIQNHEEIDRIKLMSSKSVPVQDKNFTQFLFDQIGTVSKLIRHATTTPTVPKKNRDRVIHEDDLDETHEKYDYLKQQKERLKRMNGDDRYE